MRLSDAEKIAGAVLLFIAIMVMVMVGTGLWAFVQLVNEISSVTG